MLDLLTTITWRYQQAGMFAYLATFVLVAQLVFAFSCATKKPPWKIAAFATVSLPALVGAIGWQVGRMRVAEVLAYVDPAQRAELQAVGNHEAFQSLLIGGVLSLVALVGTLVANRQSLA